MPTTTDTIARPQTGPATRPVQTLEIVRHDQIVAAPEFVFASILELMGPLSSAGSDAPMPMVLEAWPGGRWYRDLGDGRGHFWGHVQVIKPPTLIEICGPMFMSYAAISHIQYRLVAEGPTTRLTLTHTAVGLILPDHAAGVSTGWDDEIRKIHELSEKKAQRNPGAPRGGR